jgi:hypothetical protein
LSISIPTSYRIKIKIQYGELQSTIEWCERNCIGEWRYMEDPGGDMYIGWVFLFENDRDYIAFNLWKT